MEGDKWVPRTFLGLYCGVVADSWESLDCKEIQPVHPKEISPEYSLEGLMLKLKLQNFGHLMQIKNQLIGKDLDTGKDWERKRGDRGQDG